MLDNFDLSPDTVWDLLLFYFRDQFALNILIAGIIISFILSFSVGANDSANSWGTSVGAGTVSIGWAYILGSSMEIIGCTVLSGNVIKKIVDGIVNIEAYTSDRDLTIGNFSHLTSVEAEDLLYQEKLLGIGCISVMLGSGIWQLIASAFSWPVSGTHCIIFGLLGFTVTEKGGAGIKDPVALVTIVLVLFVSIIASMFGTALLYFPLYKYCIRSGTAHDVKNKIVYACLTGLAVGIPIAFIVNQCDGVYHVIRDLREPQFDAYEAYTICFIGIGLSVSLMVSVLAFLILFPYIRGSSGDFALTYDLRKPMRNTWDKYVLCGGSKKNGDLELKEAGELPEKRMEEVIANEESIEITRIFRPLQIISAMTGSLVHGGNDVANCIGPFVVIWYIYKDGILTSKSAEAPLGIALWGGVGIGLGLILFGKRVIMTMGTGISEMTASRGFCVEWMASLVVLIFTIAGFPLSTTHCKVGSLIGAGLAQGFVETGSVKRALKFVNFRVLSGVILSWVLTIPFAFGLSSLTYLILKKIILQ